MLFQPKVCRTTHHFWQQLFSEAISSVAAPSDYTPQGALLILEAGDQRRVLVAASFLFLCSQTRIYKFFQVGILLDNAALNSEFLQTSTSGLPATQYRTPFCETFS